jgi:hypothetical protein
LVPWEKLAPRVSRFVLEREARPTEVKPFDRKIYGNFESNLGPCSNDKMVDMAVEEILELAK